MSELLVVKVGSSSLVDEAGQLDQWQFDGIAEQTEAFDGDVVLVSSGAISAGCEELGVERVNYKGDDAGLRWLAAVGQPLLMERWRRAYKEHDRSVAQLLVTPYEMGIKHESAHFIETLTRCVTERGVAIVNENDAVADEEIKVGDNDCLSAKVAVALGRTGLWSQVLLVLLTDVDGLYEGFGTPEARKLDVVSDVRNVWHLAGGAGSEHGTGGMMTKLKAAAIAHEGVHMYLALASQPNAIELSLAGKIGTHFLPEQVR